MEKERNWNSHVLNYNPPEHKDIKSQNQKNGWDRKGPLKIIWSFFLYY